MSDRFTIYPSERINVNHKKTIISHSENGHASTSYGQKICHKAGHHEWKLKVIKNTNITIGIDDSTCKWKYYMFHQQRSNHYAYQYTGNKFECGRQIISEGTGYKTGDRIKIVLDLYSYTMRFFVNDMLSATFTDIKSDKKYRLAVTTLSNNDSVSIMSSSSRYSKFGSSVPAKPQLLLRLTHLNETIPLFKINFNMSFNKFLERCVRKHLLDLISNFDYFINLIDENKSINHTENALLSSICKRGDVLIVRVQQNIPLPAKPDDDNDDAENIAKMKIVDFNNNGNVTKEAVINHKQEIETKVIDKLLNIKKENKKLSKLLDIQSLSTSNNDIEELIQTDDEEKKSDINENALKLDYKLHLDLDFEQEMKQKDSFIENIKLELAETLNVDIDSIHINSVHSGSVILLISIDEKGTTQVYKDNILESSQFEDWSINKCIKGKNLNNYYSNKSKNLNEQSPMWVFLKNRFPSLYNVMKSGSLNKYESMKKIHSSLIEPLSFNQIAAIYLYTTNYLYKALNKSLRDGTSEFADYAVELISGINKLPMVWTKTYRGLGSNFTKYHSYIPNVYKKGNVVRWDGMNSTSLNEQTALNFSDKWVLEIEGYHARNIQPFSAVPSEDELIYLMSSHFFVTNTYNKGNKLYFKCREMPFPWNNKAILWVDDRPNNNKSLMERLEKKGIMTIPRISTYDAMQFIQYMEKIFLNNNNSFNKFRIISDMSRYERVNEQDENSQTVKNRSAGAILVDKLRKKGYNQQICIYTGNEKRAIDECKNLGHETNIKATVSTQECFKFADY